MKRRMMAAALACALLLAGCAGPAGGDGSGGAAGPSPLSAGERDGWMVSQIQVNDFAGASMELVKAGREQVSVRIGSDSANPNECIYGAGYRLEVLVEGGWRILPTASGGEPVFAAIGYSLAPGESRQLDIRTADLYGSLPDGSYRLVKSILDFRGTGDYDTYCLAAEFTLE